MRWGSAAPLLAEADRLWDKWDQPRVRYGTRAEMVAELQAIVTAIVELDPMDGEAIQELANRATSVASGLED